MAAPVLRGPRMSAQWLAAVELDEITHPAVGRRRSEERRPRASPGPEPRRRAALCWESHPPTRSPEREALLCEPSQRRDDLGQRRLLRNRCVSPGLRGDLVHVLPGAEDDDARPGV